MVFQARKGTRSLCEPAVQIRIPDGIILYHHFWHGHQHEGDDAAQSIDTVDDDAKLHKVMLYLHFSVHDGGEEAAENHEGRITGYHDFRHRGFQGPPEAAQGQNRPGDEQHQGAEDGQNSVPCIVVFHSISPIYK